MHDPTDEFALEFWRRKAQTLFKNTFLGVPTLQHPFDAWVTQEIITETRPEVIVECGSFHGGSALLWSTLLEQLVPDTGRVIAIDIDDNMDLAREVPIWDRRVTFLHGSTVDPDVVARVHELVDGRRTMVILDSAHTCEHVTAELAAYADLVSPGCYLIVQDGVVNGHPVEPGWGPGPYEAIAPFLAADDRFEIDPTRERMLFTFNPSGFLRRRQN